MSLPETGEIVIASDTIYCAENFGPPARPADVLIDSVGYIRTVERIRTLAARNSAQVWFGHDIEQFAQLKKAPEFYA